MNPITDTQVVEYVEANIGTFHDKRLEALVELQLTKLLARKNPYLFKSKNLVVAADLVRSLLSAYLSSQEETYFGDFLEGLAVHVAGITLGGMKSGATGIDLEFTKESVRYIVSVKSGPNWGNSAQVARMRSNFKTAAQIIRQGNPSAHVTAINGCCYGRDNNPDKGDHFKYCGQVFWEFITGDPEFYTRIIEPLGHEAHQRNQDFEERYGAVANTFTNQFIQDFCKEDGAIDWPKLVAFNASKQPPPRRRRRKSS